MQDEPIRYSRSQCARLFGISMDTLRYYERIGLLHVARDKRSRQCVYTEHEIMRLLDFRKIKSLGFSNDELLGTFNRTDGLSHLKVFDESLEKLQAQVDELHARMRHVRGMKGIFQTFPAGWTRCASANCRSGAICSLIGRTSRWLRWQWRDCPI